VISVCTCVYLSVHVPDTYTDDGISRGDIYLYILYIYIYILRKREIEIYTVYYHNRAA
jgi:hypothetical protein